jgi:membrane protein implicated in regulation of membrane protease activity
MKTLFLASLLLGLLLGVFAMLHGVERPDAPDSSSGPAPEPRASLQLPLVAAFATLFGLSGYLLARYAALHPVVDLSIATAFGTLGSIGVAALVVKWAIPSAKEEVVDERYLLQGAPGQVVRAIGADAPGAIEYDADGRRLLSEARSLDGSPIEAGTEVVIERVEEGVAYVERWALVEARL